MVIMTSPSAGSNKISIVNKLVLSSPLAIAIGSVLAFIGIMSPMTWSVYGMLPKIICAAIAIGIASAYCVTSYIEAMRR